MKKKLGIFLIRGGGKEGSEEQEKFVEKLNRLLKEKGIDTSQIHYEYANWYGPTQRRQEELLRRFFNSGQNIKAKGLRRFILFLVSDIVAYIGEPNRTSSAYRDTHAQIHKSVLNLKAALAEGAPLLVIASSLGTEIISNYIYDRQNPKGIDTLGSTAFERMEMLTGMFMFGNINSIYLPAYDLDQVKPFQFPPAKLTDKLKQIAYWGNIYDKNDPMGYPLKPVNAAFNAMVTEDIQINSGGWLSSWNAASHLGYWKEKKVLQRIAAYIQQVMSVTNA
jgi:hypothetical protein